MKYTVGDVFEITNAEGPKDWFANDLKVGDRLTIKSMDEDTYILSGHRWDQAARDEHLDKYCTRVSGPSATPTEAAPTPAHYIDGRPPQYEPRFVIAAWGLSYNLGSATKYIARAGRKGTPADYIRDLEKARDFLKFEIERLQGVGFYNDGKAE